MMLRSARFLAAFALTAALGSQAQAGFVPVLTSPTAGGSSSTFTYNLVFSTAGGVESLTAGNLVTLYDFDAGVTSANVSVTGGPTGATFTVTTPLTGVTPIPSQGTISPVDNSSITNITFTYNGPTLTTDTTFVATITLNGTYTTRVGQYAAQNASIAPGGTNTQLGSVFLPTAAVPEPASVAMVGLGLASVGGLALRRRSAK